jgi:hypothetical protein
MFKLDEPGVFRIPCFSVRFAMDNIPNQPIYERWPSAALSVPTGLGNPRLNKGLQRPGTLYYHTIRGLINMGHKQIWENEMLRRMSLIGLAIIPTLVSALNRTAVFLF